MLLRNRKDWFLAAVHSGYLLFPLCSVLFSSSSSFFLPLSGFLSFSCFSVPKSIRRHKRTDSIHVHADKEMTSQDEVERASAITAGLNVMFQLEKNVADNWDNFWR